MKISKKITAIMLSLTLAVTMLPGMAFAGEITADNMKHAEDEPSSYGYEETAADSATVTVTYSNDGKPLQGFDDAQTDMAHLEVTVPYFDLSLYGLEEYYRYGTDGGQGQYIDTTVIERPTMLHLYIYVAERYYLGLSEDKCGQGNDVSGVMDYMDEMHVKYFDDVDAYSSIDEYGTVYKAFGVSGSACSLYIDSGMWGRGQNLQYYRNHRYPLMSPGWGATADYALLSDGDDVDMGMFSNWNFYMDGRFLAFNRELYTVDPSETMTATLYATGTSSMGGTEETPVAPDDGTLSVTAALYDSDWNEVSGATVTDNYDGTFEVTVPETAGTYYLMAMDSNAATENACYAPATAKIVVGDAGNDEAAAALAQAKTDAKAALDEYADASDYRAAQQTTLADAITAGKAAIDEAADPDAVAAALADAKAVIDEIPTDAELTAEEAAAALAQAKTDAKAALDEYVDASDYRAAQQTTLADAITAGKAAIDEAADTDAVAAALADAKAVIDEIPTDAELTAEEAAAALAQAKTDAKAALDEYVDASDYRAAQQTTLADAITAGKAAIDEAADTDAVAAALADAKAVIDKIPTDAELTAEEAAAALAQAKRDAKAALDEYADASDYREAQQTALADAITEGKAAIDEAADPDAVAAALADAKAVIDEIPTDAELTAEEEADTPEDKPADKPVDTPEDKPADKPVDTPADKPVEKHTMKLEKKQYTISSDEPFTVTGSGEFDDFLRVLMDGKVVDPKHYVATEGSTIITFTTAFLDTLEPGEHTIEMVWTTGSVAEDIFIADNKADESAADKNDKVVEIVKSETKTQNESDTEKNSQPETGDQNALALWTILFALGAAGSIAVRRKQN